MPRPGTERVLATSTLVNTIGNGIFAVAAVLYFNQVLLLSPRNIALVFAISALAEIVATFPAGYFSDRVSPRLISLGATAVLGLLQISLIGVRSFAVIAVIMALIGLADGFSRTARSALIARVGGSDGRVRLRAYLRAVTNVGMAVGAAIGGLAITVNTPTAYRALIAVDACTYLVAAWILIHLEHVPVHPQAHSHRVTMALRDWRYVCLSLLMSVMGLHYLVLDIVLPVWVVLHTSAPKYVIALVFIINTVVVALLQVRASAGTQEPLASAIAVRQSSFVLCAACVIYPLSALTSVGWVAAAVLCLAGFVHVIGELRQAAGSWGIGFGLPPESAQGQYQAVWGFNSSVSRMVGPIFLVWLCVEHGFLGWVTLGIVFLVVGAVTVPLVKSALVKSALVKSALAEKALAE